MAAAIQPVFWVVAFVCVLPLIASFFLPKGRDELDNRAVGEDMIMAEQTTINARNQPSAQKKPA